MNHVIEREPGPFPRRDGSPHHREELVVKMLTPAVVAEDHAVLFQQISRNIFVSDCADNEMFRWPVI